MNNELNNNQHYITESFVKSRFGQNGFVQRYDVEHDSWKKNASPQFIFSGRGYTQLLEEGQPIDNSLEIEFGKVENHLQLILPALDSAAANKVSVLPHDIYKSLFDYCAFLWYLSPFAKAKAPVDFVMQLDLDLEHRNTKSLTENFVGQLVVDMLEQHARGKKYIIQGQNYLQFVFRVQFIKNCNSKAKLFRQHTRWTVYNSPLELPISDIALVDMPESKDVVLHILPISPHRVLIGRTSSGIANMEPIIYGNTLTKEAAGDVREIICLSAIKALASCNKIDVKAIRERAIQRNVKFHKIKNLEAVLSAGRNSFNRLKDFDIIPVDKDEFKKFILSFIGPPD